MAFSASSTSNRADGRQVASCSRDSGAAISSMQRNETCSNTLSFSSRTTYRPSPLEHKRLDFCKPVVVLLLVDIDLAHFLVRLEHQGAARVQLLQPAVLLLVRNPQLAGQHCQVALGQVQQAARGLVPATVQHTLGLLQALLHHLAHKAQGVLPLGQALHLKVKAQLLHLPGHGDVGRHKFFGQGRQHQPVHLSAQLGLVGLGGQSPVQAQHINQRGNRVPRCLLPIALADHLRHKEGHLHCSGRATSTRELNQRAHTSGGFDTDLHKQGGCSLNSATTLLESTLMGRLEALAALLKILCTKAAASSSLFACCSR
eukprot:m.232744 g.232744  ORF g.232744 m.232744 type:complete len:315 (-) comp22448_c1_seq2:212-1156(-)